MANYHFVYKDVEGASTQWDDIQRKLGNLPPKPPAFKPPSFTPAEDEDSKHKDKAWIDDRTEEQLEDLEDDPDLDDDRFLQEYRKKRLGELRQAAKVQRYGSVVPISGSDFVREVSQAPPDVWVVVILYKDGYPECGLLLQCLEQLATKYPATKFVKIISTDCIPNYPDCNLPTLLVYNNSAVKANYVGLHNFGRRCTPEGVALVLCQSDPVLNDGQSGSEPSSREAVLKGVQQRLIEKVVRDHEDDDDDGSSSLRLDGLLSSPSSGRSPALPLSSSSSSTLADSNGPKQPFVIGVSGGTASGKTTVCDMIIQQLHDHRVVLVNQDSFYRGLTAEEAKCVHEYNFDHPDAFDTEQFLECIEKLRRTQSVQVPIYDFKNHRRCSESFRQVNASDVIILEGILVFHDPRVRNLMNMKIFVDTDADVRLARRIRRDTVERGRDINSVLEQYAKFVKPAFDDFVLPSKKYADVIIPRGGDNHVAIDLIVQHIRPKLGQHDLCKIYPNVYVIQSTFQLRGMHTLIRDCGISKHDFVFYSDRLIRLVVEHGLGHLPFTEKQVVTPTGSMYTGVDFCKKLCGVSIIRRKILRGANFLANGTGIQYGGESMENALRACCKGIKIGKILIHSDGDNGKQLIYEKLPKDISERHVLLLDPVLATGNSANQAIELLIQKGVPESHIIFLNLISAPEGIHCVCKRFPSLKIVTSEIDVALNEEFRVIPGMGEFGDRYFGTDD
ncbi:hypothetical protein LOK49_LG14G01001 [Camellia lanceoleosa]|uniref:Uncharacterized protein n=1 Tax=Camellia lanceoleosa TaxID=1840588 RepID=A0ACC0FD21_9ERIC|nr:hypothetical protein LOK49_LG14G01001 [Camellia lanceoleosa]